MSDGKNKNRAYEILSFYAKNVGGCGKFNPHPDYIWSECDVKGKWYRGGYQQLTIPYGTECILRNKNYAIHSVVRKYDDKIFTVGETLFTRDGTEAIYVVIEFIITNITDTLFIRGKNIETGVYCETRIDLAMKTECISDSNPKMINVPIDTLKKWENELNLIETVSGYNITISAKEEITSLLNPNPITYTEYEVKKLFDSLQTEMDGEVIVKKVPNIVDPTDFFNRNKKKRC